MSEPLPFVAFADPGGTVCGLAVGDAPLIGTDVPDPAAGEVAGALADAGSAFRAITIADLPAVSGTLPHPAGADSLRLAVALFGERSFALSGLRPRRARGHDRDEIQAVVYEAGEARPVEDPRVSVTFAGTGDPRRVGLELWLQESEDGTFEFPRRAAGEIHSGPVELQSSAVTGVAHPVQWRSRGEDGSGWFAVLRAR